MKDAVAPLQLHIADRFLCRLKGLLGHGNLASNEGLVLAPCSAVHTFFMMCPIDVVFLDKDGGQQKVVHALPTFRVAWAVGAWCAIELPAHYCRQHPDYLERIHAAFARVRQD